MKISCEQLMEKLEAGDSLVIWDVRTPAEFEDMRIAGSRLMSLGKLDPDEVKRQVAEGGSGVVVCHSGKRSDQAIEQLEAAGCEGLLSLAGGLEVWERMGFPLEKSAGGRLSVIRQVHTFVGLMVLLGTTLALTVDMKWAAIPLFFGAGLTFAGLTGFCGLAFVLARMPWNKVASS